MTETSSSSSSSAETQGIAPVDSILNTLVEARFKAKDEPTKRYIFELKQPLSDGPTQAAVSFEELGPAAELEPEQEVTLLVERVLADALESSLKKAQKLELWQQLAQKAQRNEIVEGLITSANTQGLFVDVGLRAFVPRHQVDLHKVEDLEAYVGRTERFVVTKFDPERAELILSRRVLLETARKKNLKKLETQLVEGARLSGTVRGLKPYGAFVDVGGMEGLLHVSHMSWGRLDHPSELFEVGDQVEVMVLSYEPERRRLALGRKQLLPDPWQDAAQRYHEGDVLTGKVVNLADFGAFVEISPGLEGLVHVSELSWTQRINHPRQVLTKGQEIAVKVIQLDPQAKRLGLSVRQLEEDPWVVASRDLQEGQILEGTVRNLADFGVFVQVADGVDGLVHVSDISWTEDQVDLKKRFEPGQQVQVKVLAIDPAQQRLSLGIKQLSADPWDEVVALAKPGQKVKGVVTRTTNFGAFVQLVEGVEGLIHVSELAQDRVENPNHVVKPGQEVEALVLSVERANQRISLSLKRDALDDEEIKEYDEGSKATSTLGDILREQLKQD